MPGSLPILVVDDEPFVRALAAAALNRAGYHTLEAGDGEDALRQLQSRNGEIALVLSDIRMPGMDGLELAGTVKREFPNLRVVLMSAFSYDPVPVSKTRFFIPKPFTPASLVTMVELALAHAAAGKSSKVSGRARAKSASAE